MRTMLGALMVGVLSIALVAIGGEGGPGAGEAKLLSPAAAAFERFKSLEGTWRGKSTKGWEERVIYKTIAAGSCVMETSFDAHPNEMMVTMVHLDGGRLLLTHYCVAKNQPRLVATDFGADGSTITFTYLDGTGMEKGRDTGHMDKVVFVFKSADEFTSRWTWYQDGSENWLEEIVHARVKDDGADPKAAPAKPGEKHSHH